MVHSHLLMLQMILQAMFQAVWLLVSCMYHTVKTFEGETFHEFEVLWLFAKVSSAKFGCVASFGSTSEQSAKAFSVKIV